MQMRCTCILCINIFLYPQVRHSLMAFSSMPNNVPSYLLGLAMCYLPCCTGQPASSPAASDDTLLFSCANFGIHWPAVEEPAQHPI